MDRKNFLKRFWWLFLILAGVVLAIFFINKNILSVPACPNNLSGVFSHPLVDPDIIISLEPIGAVNGQDHILPVDHVYFSVKPDQRHHAVYAPSDMTITDITAHKVLDPRNSSEFGGYYFVAEICKGLNIWVYGIDELSPFLQTVWTDSGKKHEKSPLNYGETVINETIRPNIKIKAGEIVAYSGAEKPGSSIEVTAMDQNHPQPDIDWSYYGNAKDRRVGVLCFADLYSNELKEKFYSKFGSYGSPKSVEELERKISEMKKENIDKEKMDEIAAELLQKMTFIPRLLEPRCGTIFQNIPGTIQGDWFYGKPEKNENLEAMGKTMSFLHYNFDPKLIQISVGGTIINHPFTMRFMPGSNRINTEPSRVKADEKVYCYSIGWGGAMGKVLVQLIDNQHLKAEFQSGECFESEAFIHPFIYER